ncbi:MAG: putative secreted glycosyl hydrolase [Fibrobacteres bacterium]|nr:putative secreted glycosyl hydrolase [Fibrobacterota bacterium]
MRRHNPGSIPTSNSSLASAALALALFCLPGQARAQAYHPIFDGKTFKGWHFQGGGSWRVVDGVIEGTHTLEGDFGHLVSDSSFGDFRLRYKWKLTSGGNSGLYFHAQEGGEGGMAGAQLEMDESFSGGIYSTATQPWGWIAQPKAEDAKKWYRPNDWNEAVLVMKGSRAYITMNGMPTVDVTSAKLGTTGHLAFQVHQGIVMTLLIKEVEMSEAPATTALGKQPESAFRRRTSESSVYSVLYSRGDAGETAYSVKGARIPTAKSPFFPDAIQVSHPEHGD